MKSLAQLAIKAYQLCLSPFLGSCCRFYPSCSNYASEAIDKHGLLKGLYMATLRIFKCGPWHSGGVDLP